MATTRAKRRWAPSITGMSFTSSQSWMRAFVLTITLLAVGPAFTEQLSAVFTYQGQLKDAGQPATGPYDFQFRLFSGASGGVPLGVTVTRNDVSVVNGLFVVTLDFGQAPFSGSARHLEIAVRPGPSTGPYTSFSERQELTVAPHAIYSMDAGGLAGQPPSFYTSLANQTGVLSISQGGTGAMSVDAARGLLGVAPETFAPFAPSMIDGAGANVGRYPSIAIGVDGFGLISYYDQTNGALKVAHCLDRSCSAAEVSLLLDGTGLAGAHTAIAIGADGLGLIAYRSSVGRLAVAHCANLACTGAALYEVDPTVATQVQYISITIGADGLGFMSYNDGLGSLKAAHCENLVCSLASIVTVDAGSVTGQLFGLHSSVSIGGSGFPLISYEQLDIAAGEARLKVASCSNVTCSAAVKSVVDATPQGAINTSLMIGADGLGLIAYGSLVGKVARCSDVACTTSTLAAVGGAFGEGLSLTIGADGLGVIAVQAVIFGANLAVIHCRDASCSASPRNTIDSSGILVPGISMAIGRDGFPLIAYYDQTNGNLKTAHCTNASCALSPRKR